MPGRVEIFGPTLTLLPDARQVLIDCRHHFAAWFVMRGGSLQALKELLGHADLKMTLR